MKIKAYTIDTNDTNNLKIIIKFTYCLLRQYIRVVSESIIIGYVINRPRII